jgi:hypothetical protein
VTADGAEFITALEAATAVLTERQPSG